MTAGLCALALVAAPTVLSPARAAAQGGTDTGIDANLRWPGAGPSDFVSTRSTRIAPDGRSHVRFELGYQQDPVVLTRGNEEHAVVGAQLDNEISVAYGLFDRLQIGAAVPLVLVQTGVGTSPLDVPSGVKDRVDVVLLKDIRLSLDVLVVGRGLGARRADEGDGEGGDAEDVLAGEDGAAAAADQEDGADHEAGAGLGDGSAQAAGNGDRAPEGIGLLLSLGTSLPTGDEFAYAGDDRWVIVPQAVVDYRIGPWLIGADFSGRIRTATAALGSARLASSLHPRLAAAYWGSGDRWAVSAELGAALQLVEQAPESTVDQHAYEAGVGGRYVFGDYALRSGISFGGGGFGAPLFRLVAGLETAF